MSTTVVNVQRETRGSYVLIGRPSVWGNPFRIGRDGTRAEVIEKFRAYLAARPDLIDRARRELRGRHLGCWCAPLACHGDVLAEIAESEPVP